MSQLSCPLCQQQNNCSANHDCWCMSEPVPKALIEQVQKQGIKDTCICQACIKKFKLEHPDSLSSHSNK